MNLQKITLDFTLTSDNPNSFDLDVKSVTYAAFIKDIKIAEGERAEPVTLTAKEPTELHVPVNVFPEKLIDVTKEFMFHKESLILSLKGAITIDGTFSPWVIPLSSEKKLLD